jgi:MFS family permease
VSNHRPTGQGGRSDEATAFAVFSPRRGRTVALAFVMATLLLFGLIAVFLPGPDEGGTWRTGDKIFFAGVGVAIAFLLWRFASIRATPTREGITVRNLITTRVVPWRTIVDVRFGGGDPWVTVELDDTDTLAIMAIQKADAEYGRSEASRLMALVQALGPSAKSPDVTLD